MAGIYVHIPFCKSRCAYCAFYSSTALSGRQQYIDELCRQMAPRSDVYSTVYVGGGTPSVLTAPQLKQLFAALYNNYNVSADAEVTIECNPDDVDADFAELLRCLPVNRVSLGAQTFSDQRLRFLGRRHVAEQVAMAVAHLRRAGIGNVSVDLMYGFPGETLADWDYDIEWVLALGVEHVSAYALSYEEGTPLCRLLDEGRVEELGEELLRDMYYRLKQRLEQAGYEHYEISNFALPGYRSRHNSSYWDHTPYLGLGRGAHSYDGHRHRWWNEKVAGEEFLSDDDYYDEQVMTALRTRDGLDLSVLESDARRAYCLQRAAKYVACGWLRSDGGRLRLTSAGLFVSDTVIRDLMWER